MKEKNFKEMLKDIREKLTELPGAGELENRYIFCHIQHGDSRKFFCNGFELKNLDDLDFLKNQDCSTIIISISELGREIRKKYKTKIKKKHQKAEGEDSLYFFA